MVDADCVRQAQQGDRTAIVRLLREVENSVYKTAYYMLGNEHDALDCTQEALLRIYHRIASFKGESRFETWVQRIVTNICIDHRRRSKKTLPLEEEIGSSDPASRHKVEWSGVASDLRSAIKRLPEHQRTAVVLRYVHGYRYDEIAESMNLPLNTVKSHLFRGRKNLQAWLVDYQEGGVIP
ncbi:RNA polymerase subunit sigma-24 [Marinithermofilum abyssi]|uniref:RNA polymerase subunit sigma-24 n=1 Tax=Marinithermofilum abyssi TaxID=1571185 RepID=A0A8J2VCS6_9BACL|nr:RNA polymerase sigma factor [Marinithermofilum abyssi]GGE14402.1 RNA polymerase subunit sigma-24 [Marinithermofilum abyssi]